MKSRLITKLVTLTTVMSLTVAPPPLQTFAAVRDNAGGGGADYSKIIETINTKKEGLAESASEKEICTYIIAN